VTVDLSMKEIELIMSWYRSHCGESRDLKEDNFLAEKLVNHFGFCHGCMGIGGHKHGCAIGGEEAYWKAILAKRGQVR
jgi:hypothetical protein